MSVGQKRKRPAPDSITAVDDPRKPVAKLQKSGRETISPSPSLGSGSPSRKDIKSKPTAVLQGKAGGEDTAAQLERIAASSRTPFEKRVLSLLCQIPRGQVSTYGILSARLGSSPRAVGGALRRNPFAPEVPCHRVVATGGSLGGFKGRWPVDGEGITIDEKKRLLRSEGIRFDAKGMRVLGTPWGGFK